MQLQRSPNRLNMHGMQDLTGKCSVLRRREGVRLPRLKVIVACVRAYKVTSRTPAPVTH